MYIYEAHRGISEYKISFKYKNKIIEFESDSSMKNIFGDIVDWLYKNGYEFTDILNKNEVDEIIKRTTYRSGHFHNINNTGKYLQIHINNTNLPLYLLNRIEKFLSDIGVTDVKKSGFDLYSKLKTRIKPFIEYSDDEDYELEPIEKTESYSRNPFGGQCKSKGDKYDTSALFVVGDSGSGKTTRILKLLESNNHKTLLMGSENITSNIMFDYDHSEGYLTSDVCDFILEAKNDPSKYYTVIFDECHEYISEIKRSIFHAISSRRGEKRFFSVKKTNRKLVEDLESYQVTGKLIPDNVGFIFISSKLDVFEYHPDFMGRVDKIIVKREDHYPYPNLKSIQDKIDRTDQL